MDYIRKVIKDFDVKTFKAQPVLNELEVLYPRLSTRSVKISRMRGKLLEQVKVGNESGKEYYQRCRREHKKYDKLPEEVMKLKLKRKEYFAIKKKQADALEEKLDHQVIIKNHEQFKKEILAGLKMKSYAQLFPALLLATGRRTIEVLKTGRFTKLKDEVVFRGAVKSSTYKGFKIPLLAPVKDVQKALRRLRNVVPEIKEDDMTNKDVQAYLSKRNRTIFKNLSEKYGIELTPHMMRSIYVAMTYPEYGGDKTINGFASKVLCHSDNITNLHYVSIKLA